MGINEILFGMGTAIRSIISLNQQVTNCPALSSLGWAY